MVSFVPCLAFAGLRSAFREDRTSFWFLFFIVMADLAYALSYEIAEDKDAYYLPAFISVAIAAGFGIRWLIQLSTSKAMALQKTYWIAAAAVLLISATAFAANWPFNNRRHYFIAHDYVANMFSTIKPNGLLLTQDWQVAAPMFYEQEVEQRGTTSMLSISICYVAHNIRLSQTRSSWFGRAVARQD